MMLHVCALLGVLASAVVGADAAPPHPIENPTSPLMLKLPGMEVDSGKLDFSMLPKLRGEHAVITRGDEDWRFRLHSYLARFDGRFWAIWSHGPVIEDRATQHVRYATSADGLRWSEAKVLVAPPDDRRFGYIARGLWIRDGQLLALASYFEAPSAFGGKLSLHAFRFDAEQECWIFAGVVFDDAINNFPPKRLPTGEWMMSRRDHRHNVSMLVGGTESLSTWRVVPVARYKLADGGRPEEPFWWTLGDGNLVGLFRDNARSRRLYRAFSTDNGRTWTTPVRTNFPDATSKFNAVRTSHGDVVFVSNPNPKGRNPLCLAASTDGLVFTQMAVLPIPGDGTFQYPHIIEHDGILLIAFSRNKTAIEVLRIPLAEIARLRS